MSVIIRIVLKIGRISAKAHEKALVDNIKQISYIDMVLQVYRYKNEHYEGVFHQYFEGVFYSYSNNVQITEVLTKTKKKGHGGGVLPN
jgi:hypothetical protein